MGYDRSVMDARLAREAEAKPKPVKKEVLELDLNKDGKVDKKDGKMASRVMNALKPKRGRPKKVK